MLREGFKMSPNEGQEELEEVQANLRQKDNEVKITFYKLFCRKLFGKCIFY